MWLMTTDGFFSIVHKGGKPNEHCVRARCREDLERFRMRISADFRKPIVANAGTDYPFRMYVDAAVLSSVVQKEVLGIDYSNFKDAVTTRRGRKHHDVFMRIWQALLALEPKRKSRSAGQRTFDTWDDEWTTAVDNDITVDVRCPLCQTVLSIEVPGDIMALTDEEFLAEIDRYAKVVEGECEYTESLDHFGSREAALTKIGHAG